MKRSQGSMRARIRTFSFALAGLFALAVLAATGPALAQDAAPAPEPAAPAVPSPAASSPAASSPAAPETPPAGATGESRAQPPAPRDDAAAASREERRRAMAEAGLSPDRIDDLIATLESPDGRERFLSRLKALRAAAETGEDGASASREPPQFGARIVSALSARVETVTQELVAGAALVLDAPRAVQWLRDTVSDPTQQEIWIRLLWKVLAVLAAGLVAEWLVRRLLARPRRSIEGQARDGFWVRLPFLAARMFLDIVPILAFAAAAYFVLPLLDPGEETRLVAISLINASVIARAVLAAARTFFVPDTSHLRIVSVGDETANYLVVWIRRLTNVAVYGYFLVEAALLLGIPPGGYQALSKGIGLFLALLLIILVLQNRHAVADWIRGADKANMPAVGVLRRRFADIWHVLAIIYLVATYIVWALEIDGGFDFVFRATALSIVILFVAKLLILASGKAVEHGFGMRKDLVERFPGLAIRANRYFAILHVFITIAICVLAVFAVLEAWGLDSFDWIGTPVGRRIAGSVVSSAFVIALAVIFWEMASSVIERYLARGEQGELAISARAKTLLPLLRRALLIVISTIVGFIVLSEIGVNIGPLLAGAGVVGLAIGFGSQTLVKDVITGIFILAEDQFSVGDIVRVSDKAGLVEDITIRTIRLRDLAGNVHVIPFSSVTTVENMTKDFSRYVFDVGVAYREDVDEVIAVLRTLGEEMQADEVYGPLIREPLEIMGLDSFGDSAIVIRARFTTLPIKQWQVGREFNRRIKRRFDELGIEIPFPHQTLYFGESKGGGAPPAYVRLAEGAQEPAASDAAASAPVEDGAGQPSGDTDAVDQPAEDR